MEIFWSHFSYVAAVVIGTILFAFKLPKRQYFYLRFLLCIVIGTALAYGSYYLVVDFGMKDVTNQIVIMTGRTICAFLIFCIGFSSALICFRCSWKEALFCSTCGYATQHLSQRLNYVILTPFMPGVGFWFVALSLVGVTSVCYVLVYFAFIRPLKGERILISNIFQLSVASIIVLFDIFLNSFATLYIDSPVGEVYNYIFSIIVSILGIFLETTMTNAKNNQIERDAIQKMMHEEHRQYRFEKNLIDSINIKSHDLKHQIYALNGKIYQSELEGIIKVVDSYDSLFNTGNEALDVILTRKSFDCNRKHIKLTCLADGPKLNFMKEPDIYSLFGNILDNAIEAVDQVDDLDKKYISLTVKEKGQTIIITETNYFSGPIEFSEGLPVTLKKDRRVHGFGVQSIKSIAEKYNGDLTINGDEGVFTIYIILPLPLFNN